MISIDEFSLEAALAVCSQVPDSEREVYAAFAGVEFVPQHVAAWAYNAPGPKWVISVSGAPVVICGGLPLTPGVYRTWFYGAAGGWHYFLPELTDAAAKIIQNSFSFARRIETVTLADRHKTRAWYERIGLHYESTLHGYGVNNEDAVMYFALKGPETVHV